MASEIKVDTISEKTSAGGVTIDGLLIKDGGISGDVSLIGTTPTFTIGDAGAVDAALVFDGNAQDYYIALDDSADDLVIGLGSTVGTTPAVSIDENLQVIVHDNLSLLSDSSVLKFGTDGDTTLTHTDGTGLTLNSTNKICFNDASQFIQGSSNAILALGATDEIDLTATAVDLNGTLDVSGTSQFNAAVTLAGTTPTLTIGDAGAEDTKIVFDGNAQDWHIGLDDSADDLVIGLGSTLGTTTHMSFDETGAILKPLQPAFLATASAQANVTGDNTDYDIAFATETFDQNADFGGTSFTAPVTGRYVFYAEIDVGGLTTAHTQMFGWFESSNSYSYVFGTQAEGTMTSTNELLSGGAIYFADMDANDTIKVIIDVRNGTKVVDIANTSRFGGYLAC